MTETGKPQGALHHWFHDWPRWLRISLTLAVLAFAAFMIFAGFYRVNWKTGEIAPVETAAERGCRETRESIVARVPDLRDRLAAQRAEVAAIVQSMAKTREACLAEVSNRPEAVQRGCIVEPWEPPRGSITFPTRDNRTRDDPPPPPQGASGYHRAVLVELEAARAAAAAKIPPLVEEQNRLHEERRRLDQRCSAGEQQPGS